MYLGPAIYHSSGPGGLLVPRVALITGLASPLVFTLVWWDENCVPSVASAVESDTPVADTWYRGALRPEAY